MLRLHILQKYLTHLTLIYKLNESPTIAVMWARDLRQSLNSQRVMLVPLNSDAAGPKRKKLLCKDFVIKKLKQIFPTDVSSQTAVTLTSKWPEQQGSRSTSKPLRGYLGTASGTKELVPPGVVSPSITEGEALTASQRAAATCCTAGTVPQSIHLPPPGYSPLTSPAAAPFA